MKKLNPKVVFPVVGGSLLIAVGLLFLLNNLEIVKFDWGILIGPLVALGGVVFLLVFILNSKEWWTLIPGFDLIGIGSLIFMSQNFTSLPGILGTSIFLAFLGLPFLLIFITHRQHWWALIPGGVLITFVATSLVPLKSVWSGVIFFIGLAITFGLIYILPKPAGRLTWALYPAVILLLIGILEYFDLSNVMKYVFPLALLVGGGYVLFRAIRR